MLEAHRPVSEVDLVEFVASWQQAVQGSKVVVGVEVKLKKGRPVVSPSEGLTTVTSSKRASRIPD